MKDIGKRWERIIRLKLKVEPKDYKGPDIFGLAPEFEKFHGLLPFFSAENTIALLFFIGLAIASYYIDAYTSWILTKIILAVVFIIFLFWLFIFRREGKK